jgi:hypothetical protein
VVFLAGYEARTIHRITLHVDGGVSATRLG